MTVAFPLKLAAGKRYLVDQNGVPFLGLGDSPWNISMTLSATDQATYLADRKARGFNMMLVECIDNQFNYGNTTAGSTWGPNANGDLPFTTKQGGGTYNNAQTQSPDFSTPNGAYWTFHDATLNRIAAQGNLILLYPAWIGNPIADPGGEGYYNALVAQSSGIRQGYGAFLANRYGPGGTNPIAGLIWGIGGDNTPTNTAVNTDIVTGIQSVITSPTPLIFVDGLDGDSMVSRWGSNSWFNVNGVYSDSLISHPWAYAQCKTEYQNTAGLQSFYPQFWKEGGYEFGQTGWTEQFVRGQNWQAMLGGCWGYCMGVNGLWQFAPSWQTLLSSVMTIGAQALNVFFSSRRWDLLVPDWGNAFLTNGGSYSNATFASAALASDGSWGAVYVPTNESLTVKLGLLSPPTVNAYWVDPTNGTRTLIAGSPFTPTGSHTFAATPGNNANSDADWVLLLESPSVAQAAPQFAGAGC
jgi:hypothetical protein